jgi:hypothetical protein
VFIFSSCKNKEIIPDINSNTTINFQGEKLQLSSEITENDVDNYLNYSVDTYNKNLKNNVENDIDWSKVPSEVFYKILYSSIAKFPDMSKESYTDDDFAFVKKGLTELKDKEEAFIAKKHIVVDYMEILIGKEIKKEVKLFIKSNKGAKPVSIIDWLSPSYSQLNPTEQDCAAAYPLGANDVKKAKDQAYAYFPGMLDNTTSNAKFHAFWAAGMVKEICHTTLNKWKGLDRGKKFATAHEYDTNNIVAGVWTPGHIAVFNVRDYVLANYMDLNNNLVGRTYMYNTVGQTWLGNANNIPAYATIFNYVSYNCSITQKTSIQAILDMSSGYTNTDNLGHYTNAFDYHPTTNGQLVYIQ